MATSRNLSPILKKLLEHHGEVAGPAIDDPFHLVLWEQVAYLADDERRRDAFQLLACRVGLSPEEILRAGMDLLTEIAASGGTIATEKRATRMQASAQRVVSEWSGNLKNALRLPVAQATRALSKFPMIGKPGAEKILLLTRTYPLLALDSNGLRVLLRLGYGSEDKRYDKSYENVRASTAAEERADYDWLISLHRLLRRHGQEVCRRKDPRCAKCPLTGQCAYYAAHSGV